jgi:hypothetical protein
MATEDTALVFSLEISRFPQCFQEPFRHFAAFWAIEIATEFLFVGMAITSPMRVLFTPFYGGYEPNPHDLSGVNLGPIKNQSGGLDFGIITSIELSAPRRQHLAT